jgi:hypothetical protein
MLNKSPGLNHFTKLPGKTQYCERSLHREKGRLQQNGESKRGYLTESAWSSAGQLIAVTISSDIRKNNNLGGGGWKSESILCFANRRAMKEADGMVEVHFKAFVTPALDSVELYASGSTCFTSENKSLVHR